MDDPRLIRLWCLSRLLLSASGHRCRQRTRGRSSSYLSSTGTEVRLRDTGPRGHKLLVTPSRLLRSLPGGHPFVLFLNEETFLVPPNPHDNRAGRLRTTTGPPSGQAYPGPTPDNSPLTTDDGPHTEPCRHEPFPHLTAKKSLRTT